MKRFLTGFSVIVIILFSLSVFGWMVKHITIGDKNFGDFTNKSISHLVSFPELFKKSVEETKTLPPTFLKTDDDFEPINELEEDVLALITYSDENDDRTVELRNLKTDESVYKWHIENPFESHNRIMTPILLPNKSLCYSFNGASGIYVIDSLGNQVWYQDSIAHHHAMELDADGNIWACTYIVENGDFIIYKGRFYIDDRELVYIDNAITQLDSKTGDILFHKSFSEILIENNLQYLLLRSNNAEDPIHLNDVQPALKTTDYYEKGDLFLSSRNLSLILHYRPSTNKVIKVLEGPFYSQHDVDIYNDQAVCFFNNNAQTLWQDRKTDWLLSKNMIEAGNFISNEMIYDYETDEYRVIYNSAFKIGHIFTFTEGVAEFLPDSSLFVEQQNSGLLWVVKDDQILYKNVIPSHHEGYHHLPNWTRIIQE